MTCSHCGATLNEGAAFCQNCGQPVSAQQPQQDAYQQPTYQQYQQQQQNAYQQPPYQNPYGYQQEGTPVKSSAYLAWSIVVTVVCCWPFGIPAIVNAARINRCNDAGDYIGAAEAAKKSKTWTIVSACVGFALGLVAFIINLIQG